MIRVILIAFFVGICCLTWAQSSNYSFHNFSEKHGLVNNIIFCTLKDSKGILWVGTQNGLSRFDGSHFHNFKRKRDKNSLPHNAIESICEDKQGNIWGGTDKGFFCFSSNNNLFKNFDAPKNCFDNIGQNIICDKQGNIYASTSLDLIKFNPNDNKFEPVISLNPDHDSFFHFRLGKNKMLYDEMNHGIWLALPNGLNFYDIQKNKILNNTNMPNQDLFTIRSTSALALSPTGKIWFADNTNKVLIELDPKTKSVIRKISFKEESAINGVTTLLIDKQQRIWMNNWSYDIMCIHTKNQNRIDHIKSIDDDNSSIASTFFWDALEDENGSVWIGTASGISIYNSDKKIFRASGLPTKIPELVSTAIYVITENPNDKSWWISTSKNDIIEYFPEKNTYNIYHPNTFPSNALGKKPGNVSHIYYVNDDVLVTTGDGAWQRKKGAKSFMPSTLLPKQFDDFIVQSFQETDSIYYFANSHKILAYNKINQATHWIHKENPDSSRNILNGFRHLLYAPNQKFMWAYANNYIGSEGDDGKSKTINIIKDSVAEKGESFFQGSMDKNGNAWIINKAVGIYRYNPHTNEVKYWSDLDGLSSNHLHAIIADSKDKVWCTYYNQVSVFNIKENNFVNFTIPYAENKLNYFNNLTQRKDGVVMGNVYNDIFEFIPEHIENVPIKKTPQFSSISISDIDYFPNKNDKLQLKSNQNSLLIRFGLLIDNSIFPHEFEYMLEGIDDQWHEVMSMNYISFNNLPSGNYTFRVRAKGINKKWLSDENYFHFSIKTPFYKSTLFFFLLATLIVGSIYAFYRYRLLQKEKLMYLESRAQRLEKEKSLVMYESLKQQLNPHFLFNSLTSLSGLIQLDQNLAGNFLEQMSGIYRYILKHDDSETVYLKDEVNFVQLYIKLQLTRFSKGLNVHIDIPDEYLTQKIAPVTLQNLIENAIKHNIIDADSPLLIDIFIENDYIVVKNNLQRKNKIETSNKKGLIQFVTLYKYLSERPVLIEEDEKHYQVKIPLI